MDLKLLFPEISTNSFTFNGMALGTLKKCVPCI